MSEGGMVCEKKSRKFVLIQVVPLLVLFLTEFLSFCRKERKVLRKVLQSFFVLYGQCFQSARNKRNCEDLQIAPK
ncbi:hypothetical protein C7N43_13020 [Sphingobacteriales bacterium UPWRP_1]|nr:hypothetical protein C7N43_13020 [Sphingobacteriales bacterium UPWRP_1]